MRRRRQGRASREAIMAPRVNQALVRGMIGSWKGKCVYLVNVGCRPDSQVRPLLYRAVLQRILDGDSRRGKNQKMATTATSTKQEANEQMT